MRIIDTFSQAEACFVQGRFSIARWRDYMERCLPGAREMVEQDAAEYDFDREILPVLNQTARQPEKLRELHNSFLGVTEGRSDIGYYLGAELVKAATNGRTRQQLLDLGFEEALELLQQCAEP